MEMEEIVKVLIFVLVLAILVGGVIVLFKGKGFDLLSSIRDILRFGQ